MAILIVCPVCHSDEVDFLNPQSQPTQTEMDEYEFWTENMGMEPPGIEKSNSYGPVWIGCNECFLIWDECLLERNRRFPYGKLK